MAHAYALKDSAKDWSGGSVARADGTTLDIAALIVKGGGTIVTDDAADAALLDGYEALKRVAVPEKEKPAARAEASGRGAGEGK